MRPEPDEVYRGVTRLFAAIILAFGVTIVVVTIAHGGGPGSFGVLIGILFCLLGGARLYLSVRKGG
jgi:hypothetical protein